ncbi:hypothetical protein SAMN02745704_00227 [Paucidesulfovibrio gracilis DSM 16080]|uniref:Uncharacterized protein n=1 Tax=Paucidesulfovibrio gracilis DSM 16080 TaxID=1121449 RepID=A0A1T4W5A3_9BACT|nr:hypothetical protein [Paucidesulfovibrio gracilis]SKA71871.1 hypothetical protein SAMN02745704_00227 [Paucidesulfovibrio gracilis DSM 16080]
MSSISIGSILYKIVFSFMTALALGVLPVWAEAGNTIPDSVDGIRMGAFLSDLEGLAFSRDMTLHDEVAGDSLIRYYVRSEPPAPIGGVVLDRLEFGFCDGYVCSIRGEAAGEAAYHSLRKYYSRQYGTENRRVLLYGSQWDRYCEEDWSRRGSGVRWVLCEHATDNCAVFSIRYDPQQNRTVLLLGDAFTE